MGGADCLLVTSGFGPPGRGVRAETVVSGLEVPWSVAFLPGGELLVTERPGRLRLVQGGALVDAPVATVPNAAGGEGGVLGLALHPAFATNRALLLYVTVPVGAERENRVERWVLAPDSRSARFDAVVFGGIGGALVHDGGRLRLGPDGQLYVGTGDARDPERAQAPGSLNGKVLRLTPEGAIPSDNPTPGSPVFLSGLRNTQGFDWLDASTLVVVDHGPSGDLARAGHDEVNVAKAGDNLGWPTVYGCGRAEGLVPPRLTWTAAVPPGGVAVYRGRALPGWQGDVVVGALGAKHVHRVRLDADRRVASHEVHLEALGRVRDVVTGPDGELYATTSNCDGRGACPPERDRVVKLVPE